jgi:hypothetical protein
MAGAYARGKLCGEVYPYDKFPINQLPNPNKFPIIQFPILYWILAIGDLFDIGNWTFVIT